MEEKLEELKTLTEILNKQGITLETPQIKKQIIISFFYVKILKGDFNVL